MTKIYKLFFVLLILPTVELLKHYNYPGGIGSLFAELLLAASLVCGLLTPENTKAKL